MAPGRREALEARRREEEEEAVVVARERVLLVVRVVRLRRERARVAALTAKRSPWEFIFFGF